MTARVAHLVRHPIKSAGFEEVAEVRLTAGAAFPFDRFWAVAHAAARLSEPVTWAPKLQFMRGWGSADLMAVSCISSDPDKGEVTLAHPRREQATFRPDDTADADRLIEWLRPLWPANRPDPARVVRVPGQALTDQEQPLVSVNSLSSLADLSARTGRQLSMHRWRGNIWVDGWKPMAELDLIGREITLGDARLLVEEPIGRCRATGANPDTGEQDVDTMAALDAAYGHSDFGVFARVIEGGRVSRGDEVQA